MKRQLIAALGLAALPAEEQENALARVGSLIFQSVLLRIAPDLAPEKQTELEKLLSGTTVTDPGAVFAFFEQNVPSFSAIVIEEVQRFKTESAAVMNSAGKTS